MSASDGGRRAAEGSRRLRAYKTLRTAHLERAVQLPPADIVYVDTRYDFDTGLADRVRPVRRSELGAAWLALRGGYDVVEVNEPAALDCARLAAGVVGAARLRGLLTGRRPVVVTYAIGNVDPRVLPRPAKWWPRLGRVLDLRLARWVWRRCDRVVFGTDTAREVYADAFGPLRPGARATTIPALPSPCDCEPAAQKDPESVLFLGDLSPRKGFDKVVAAWPRLCEGRPSARLVVVGRGKLADAAEDLARRDERVRFVPDPPRDVVHAELARAAVLVLPSQRTPAWREQVGLPLVEGLAHGCTIVTTDETGIAGWLREHGHHVVDAGRTDTDLAKALATAVDSPLAPDKVRASLPLTDSRLAADAWLFGDDVAQFGELAAEHHPLQR